MDVIVIFSKLNKGLYVSWRKLHIDTCYSCILSSQCQTVTSLFGSEPTKTLTIRARWFLSGCGRVPMIPAFLSKLVPRPARWGELWVHWETLPCLSKKGGKWSRRAPDLNLCSPNTCLCFHACAHSTHAHTPHMRMLKPREAWMRIVIDYLAHSYITA